MLMSKLIRLYMVVIIQLIRALGKSLTYLSVLCKSINSSEPVKGNKNITYIITAPAHVFRGRNLKI